MFFLDEYYYLCEAIPIVGMRGYFKIIPNW